MGDGVRVCAGVRVCVSCWREKPLDDFGPHRTGPGGLNRSCRECCRIASKVYTARKRGGTFELEDVVQAFAEAAERGGICPICRERPVTCIDHDHETGELRGVLCHQCNAGIGLLRDDPEVVERALAWLTADRIADEMTDEREATSRA